VFAAPGKQFEPVPRPSSSSAASSTSSSSPVEGLSSRPKREVVKRKRLIEEDDFDLPKRDLLVTATRKLKASANAMAHEMGHLFRDWTGSRRTFAVGDQVMARYPDGQWFSASIDEVLSTRSCEQQKFRITWDDGDTASRVKNARDMMLLEEFTARADRTVKRHKAAEQEHQEKSKDEKSSVSHDGEACQDRQAERQKGPSNAVYTFEVAGAGTFQRRGWGLRMVDSGASLSVCVCEFQGSRQKQTLPRTGTTLNLSMFIALSRHLARMTRPLPLIYTPDAV
jgi:hypothetical protein